MSEKSAICSMVSAREMLLTFSFAMMIISCQTPSRCLTACFFMAQYRNRRNASDETIENAADLRSIFAGYSGVPPLRRSCNPQNQSDYRHISQAIALPVQDHASSFRRFPIHRSEATLKTQSIAGSLILATPCMPVQARQQQAYTGVFPMITPSRTIHANHRQHQARRKKPVSSNALIRGGSILRAGSRLASISPQPASKGCVCRYARCR